MTTAVYACAGCGQKNRLRQIKRQQSCGKCKRIFTLYEVQVAFEPNGHDSRSALDALIDKFTDGFKRRR